MTKEKQLLHKFKNNINIILILSFFMEFAGSWAVIQILFFKELNLSFEQISLVLMIVPITTLIAEIPTGLYGDLYGRKKSMVVSLIFSLIGTSLLINANDFYHLIIPFILFGLSYSFWSGTSNSLLYESLKKVKKSYLYTAMLIKVNFLFVGVGILTNLFIPMIFEINISYPFIISVFFGIVILSLTFFLTDTEQKKAKLKNKREGFLIHLKISLNHFKTHKLSVWLLLFSAFWGLTFGLFGNLINQPLIRNSHTLTEYGIMFSSATVIQTLIIWKTELLLNFIKKYNPFIFLVIIWSFLLFLLTIVIDDIYLTILVMGVMWWVGVVNHIIIDTTFNDNIKEDRIRASVLSINAMFTSLVYLIVLPVVGILLDKITTINFTVYLSVFALIVGFLLLLAFPKKRN